MASTAATLVAKLMADTGQFDRALAGADRSLSGLGKAGGTAGALLKSGLVAGFAATVGGAGLAIKAAGNFEQSLNVLEATSGATGKEMKAMSRLAIALGKDVRLPGTSAKDAADAMLELSKGGLKVNDVMKASRGVLQLSAAAQIDNATAAGIVADALNTFGLKGKEATRVADLLAGAANKSTGDIGDFALALQQTGAVAAQLNIPIETTVGALTEMANAGLKGSDAGTSLKTMLMSLAAPTDKAAGLMKEMGVQVFDAHGKMKPFPDLVGQFEKALGPMTEEQRNAALATIFGSDAIRAANILLGEGEQSLRKTTKAVSEQGSAQKLAEAQTKGFNGAWDGLKSTLETIAISIGSKLLPKVTDLVKKFTTWIDNVSNNQAVMDTLAEVWDTLGAVAGEMAKQLGKAAPAVTKLLDAAAANPDIVAKVALGVAALATAGGPLSSILSPAAKSIKAVGTAAQGVSAILGAMAGTASAAGSAVGGLGGAAKGAGKDADGAKGMFKNFGSALGGLGLIAVTAGIGALAYAIVKLASDTGGAAAKFREAETAARNYKSAIDGLTSATNDVSQAEIDVQRATVSLGQARQRAAEVAKAAGTASLAYKDAQLAVEQAELDVKTSSERLADAKSKVKDETVKVAKETDKAQKAVTEMGEKYEYVKKTSDGYVMSAGRQIAVQEGVNSTLGRKYAAQAEAYAGALDRVSDAAGGAETPLGGAAEKAAELTRKINAIPKFTQITVAVDFRSSLPTNLASYPGSGAVASGGVKPPPDTSAQVAKNAQASTKAVKDLGDEVDRTAKRWTQATQGMSRDIAGVATKVKEQEPALSEASKALGLATVRGYLNGTSTLPDTVSDKIQAALDRSREKVEAARTVFQDAFGRLTGDILTVFDAFTGQHMTKTEKWIADQEAAFRRGDLERAAADAQAAVNAAVAAGMDQGSREFLDLLSARDKAAFELTKLNAEATIEEERKNYDARRDLMRRNLDDRLTMLAEKLQSGEITEQQFHKKLMALLKSFGVDHGQMGALLGDSFVKMYDQSKQGAAGAANNVSDEIQKALFGRVKDTKAKGREHGEAFVDGFDNNKQAALESGEKVGRWLANGLASQAPAVRAGAKTLADAANEYLKLRSPAEKGPLSDLNTWWTPFVPTLLEGLDRDELARAVGKAAHPMGPLRPFPPFWPRPRPRPGGDNGGGGVTVIVEGSVISERDLVETVRKGLIKTGQRSSTVLSGRGVTA